MNITKENIEEQILLLVDGELDAATGKELMAYIDRHPEYRGMLDAYRATLLPAEEDIRFPDMAVLLRPEEPVALPFRKKTTLAWAASVAALLCLGIAAAVLFRNKETALPDLALQKGTGAQKKIAAPPPVAKNPAVLASAVTTKQEKNVPPAAPQKAASAAVASLPEEAVQEPVREKASIAPIATAAESTLAVTTRPVKAEAIETPEIVVAAAGQEGSAWPVNEEKLQGVNDLVSRVGALKKDIQEKARSLKGATVVLRWGNKELALGK